MRSTVGRSRRETVHRAVLRSLRLAAVLFGVVALGALYELFLGNVDICGGSSGWWIGAVFISPLIFVGLCTACATIAWNEAEKATWGMVAGLLALLYIYGTAATLMSGTLGTLWC